MSLHRKFHENSEIELVRVTADRDMALVRSAQDLVWGAFPEFAYHNKVVDLYWRSLYELFAGYQFALLNKSNGVTLALGNCYPINWQDRFDNLPDEGFEWALRTGVEQARNGLRPNMLCAFQIVISKEARSWGISYMAVETMIKIAGENGLAALIAPVRPNRKCEFPELPIDDYTKLTRSDGLPLDDWLRVHVRLGGRMGKSCKRSYVVSGSIAEWRKWTGMAFKNSGRFIVPGALAPVEIDLVHDLGTYIEPNVWMVHDV